MPIVEFHCVHISVITLVLYTSLSILITTGSLVLILSLNIHQHILLVDMTVAFIRMFLVKMCTYLHLHNKIFTSSLQNECVCQKIVNHSTKFTHKFSTMLGLVGSLYKCTSYP